MVAMARVIFVFLACALTLAAQTSTLSGHVFDESGAVVPRTNVTITDSRGSARTVASGADGVYSLTGVAPGNYSVTAVNPAMATESPLRFTMGAQSQTLDLRMKIVAVASHINVQENVPSIGIEASANASATVITGDNLLSLPDDPEDLQADLEALAGPSAGPGGGNAIFIDGFSGGQLPPKESIREVRINQNPFRPSTTSWGWVVLRSSPSPGAISFTALLRTTWVRSGGIRATPTLRKRLRFSCRRRRTASAARLPNTVLSRSISNGR